MSLTQPILGKPSLSREEEADLALRNTTIGSDWAWILVLAFLSMIVSVPLLQFAVERSRNSSHPPQPVQVFSLLPSFRNLRAIRTPGDVLHLLPKEPAIRDYESDLENSSILTEWILPPMQAALSQWGVGNEQAYCGVGGCLFYRPDVNYLTDRGFLDPAVLKARRRKGEGAAIQPDPLPTLARFNQQLKERGIELIVMPAPSKPMIQPEQLSPAFSSRQAALQNESYKKFRDALRREGIRLFDPSEALIEAKRRTGQPQFLQTDTHWTPEAMERVAHELAWYIRSQNLLRDAGTVNYRRKNETPENQGDLALMLKLPPYQTLYVPQRVRIHPVQTSDGKAWRPRKDAEVLLLGDSYSNIYSLDGMGWGKGAGFAEQLSYDLKRPLDRIVINDGGSYSTREQLLRENARGKDRLKGKRLVIWEFAMRDLIEGDWKRLDFPAARESAIKPPRQTPLGRLNE